MPDRWRPTGYVRSSPQRSGMDAGGLRAGESPDNDDLKRGRGSALDLSNTHTPGEDADEVATTTEGWR